MSEHAAPLQLVRSPEQVALDQWEQPSAPAPLPRQPLERARGALRRYRWLIVAVIAVFTAGGVVASRMVKPLYDVQGRIWIQAETPMSQRPGAFKPEELLNSQAWVELLLSSRVADAVVHQLALYLKPDDPSDSVAFRGFSTGDRFLPGKYQLDLDPASKHWHLRLVNGAAADSGEMSDSLGRAVGFKWQLTPAAFAGTGSKKILFTVLTPRETANDYASNRLSTRLPDKSSFLTISMQDADPHAATRTINAWMREYINVAQQLKKANIVQYSNILAGQLALAERGLRSAEDSLESFRVHTIMLPGSEGSPIAGGTQRTSDPAIKNYFDQKFDYDALKHDREALERILANPDDSVSVEAALFIPAVSSFPSAKALRDAFEQLNTGRAQLASARQVYTDEYPTVRDLKNNINQLETQTIPRLASNLLTQLKEREQQYEQRIQGASHDLQEIPARMIEEARLTRQVHVNEAMYNTLKTSATEAQLSEASATTPDVTILDTAVAPLAPTKNTTMRLLGIAIMLGIGAAVALALLLDAMDGRIRYPEQVTHDLGLNIATAIPRFPRGTVNTRSPEQVANLVEAFRSLRMHVRHASETPITLAVSSPQPGDGKSFVSVNLAMSFADAGYQTILVDADTRRGLAHEVFGLSMENGLTDYLTGNAEMAQIVRATSHERLAFVSCGRRRPNSPELLTSAALPRLVTDLRSRYDVVLFDTPPLNAGIDAYAIASAAANLVVVIRAGKTDRRLAAAKLLLVDRLPIQIVGAVLNAVQLDNEFQYYGYAGGYGYSDGEMESTALQTT